METQKKRKPGRPRLPKHEAKGKIVPIRFRSDDLKRIAAAAKACKMTLSEWVRSTVHAAVNQIDPGGVR